MSLSQPTSLLVKTMPMPTPSPSPSPSPGTNNIFNPGTGSAPQALVTQAQLILDIVAWTATAACVAGVLITAALMAISHHRGMGSEHFGSLGKVMTACILVATAGPIVQWLV
jgi:hypothetical protein